MSKFSHFAVKKMSFDDIRGYCDPFISQTNFDLTYFGRNFVRRGFNLAGYFVQRGRGGGGRKVIQPPFVSSLKLLSVIRKKLFDI